MKILIVGGGGREHAIALKLKESKDVTALYCAPGNGGIAEVASCINIKATDVEKMVEFAVAEGIDFAVVTPDDPLALGMVDAMEAAGIRAFGPNQAAARIESSKAFAKELMKKHGIPTAAYEVFTDHAAARAYVEACALPLVVKADGLAAGKGALICESRAQAVNAVDDIMQKRVFGSAGDSVVIEEFLTGPEVSVLAFTDGKTVKTMPGAQDHKRALDGDGGLNTGGMGAFAPSPKYTSVRQKEVDENIIKPTIAAMAAEGCPFRGVLYFGLIMTEDGVKVIEYNARFGDPETQAVLPLLKSDLFAIMNATIDGTLAETPVEFSDETAVCVVAASGGYPGAYETGYKIELDLPKGVICYHAGTQKRIDGYYTAGGRVLGITALGKNLDEAIRRAYGAMQGVCFKDMHYRTDIGRK